MSVTITFEKKHFLMLGLIIAIPFLILAIANIMAVAPSGQYHLFSELFVDSDIDMNDNKITNLSVPTVSVDAATKGYVDAAGGGGYSMCYALSSGSNVDCDEGYTAIMTSKGTGCSGTKSYILNVGSAQTWKVSYTSNPCTSAYHGTYWYEKLYQMSGSSWVEVGSVACKRCLNWGDEIYASTQALCCI